MIYISFTNWKKKYEKLLDKSMASAFEIGDIKAENRNLKSRVRRLLLELEAGNKAFVKANEILTRHNKQPRDKKGRFTKKEIK